MIHQKCGFASVGLLSSAAFLVHLPLWRFQKSPLKSVNIRHRLEYSAPKPDGHSSPRTDFSLLSAAWVRSISPRSLLSAAGLPRPVRATRQPTRKLARAALPFPIKCPTRSPPRSRPGKKAHRGGALAGRRDGHGRRATERAAAAA